MTNNVQDNASISKQIFNEITRLSFKNDQLIAQNNQLIQQQDDLKSVVVLLTNRVQAVENELQLTRHLDDQIPLSPVPQLMRANSTRSGGGRMRLRSTSPNDMNDPELSWLNGIQDRVLWGIWDFTANLNEKRCISCQGSRDNNYSCNVRVYETQFVSVIGHHSNAPINRDPFNCHEDKKIFVFLKRNPNFDDRQRS